MTSLAYPSCVHLPDKASTATPLATVDFEMPTWSFLQTLLAENQAEAHRSPHTSPFESPLGVSSIGSPNSSRDFDNDSPLLALDDDFYAGAGPNIPSDLPLFHIDHAEASSANDTHSVDPAQLAQEASSSTDAPSIEDFYHLYQQHQFDQHQLEQLRLRQLQLSATVAPHFANPGSSPLSATDMGSTFAALQDIAPLSKPLAMPFAFSEGTDNNGNILATVRRLSLSDSVSCYSSSQDSLVGKASSSPTPACASRVSTPLSGEPSPATLGAENFSEVTANFVKSFARTRDTRDTSILLSALRSAGIEVSEHLLTEIVSSCAEFQPQSSPAPQLGSPVHDAHRSSHQHRPRSSFGAAANKRAALGTTNAANKVSQTHGHGDVIYIAGKRHFRCDVCHKTFDRAFNLKTHRTIHEDQREYPFVCPFKECSKAFARKADCNRHTRSVHLKRGEKLRPGTALAVHDLG